MEYIGQLLISQGLFHILIVIAHRYCFAGEYFDMANGIIIVKQHPSWPYYITQALMVLNLIIVLIVIAYYAWNFSAWGQS